MEKVALTLRIEKDLKQAIERVAAEDHRSINNWINYQLRRLAMPDAETLREAGREERGE